MIFGQGLKGPLPETAGSIAILQKMERFRDGPVDPIKETNGKCPQNICFRGSNIIIVVA